MISNKKIGDKTYDVIFDAGNAIDRTILKTLGKMWVSDSTDLEDRNLRLGYSDDYEYMDFKQAVLQAFGGAGVGVHIQGARYTGSKCCVHLDFDYMGNAEWAEAVFRAISSIGNGIDSVATYTTDQDARDDKGYVCCETNAQTNNNHYVGVWVPFDEKLYQQERLESSKVRLETSQNNRDISSNNLVTQENNTKVAEMKVDESAFNMVSSTTSTATYVIIAIVVVVALAGLFFMFK